MQDNYFPTAIAIKCHSKRNEIIRQLKNVEPDHMVSIRFVELNEGLEPWFEQVAVLRFEDWRKGDYYWDYAHPEDLLEELGESEGN